jgi:enoyl-CoA hydratase
MLAAAMALAREIAAKAPAAIWASKQAITHARDHAVPESLAHMALLQAAMWAADDVREAVAAAREKRAARFDDLPPDYAFGR